MWNRRFGALLCVVSLGGTALAQDVPLEWNVRAQALGLFAKLQSGQAGSLGIVGDSISFKPNSYNWVVRDRFWSEYGDAGDGYLSTGLGFNSSVNSDGPRDGLKITTSLTGVELGGINSDRSAWGYYTPDGIYARVQDAGYVQLTLFGPACRLHYLVQPGGGVMRLSLNGGAMVDIPTDGALAHAWFDFGTGGGPDSLNTLKITSADGRVVQTSGVDMRNGLGGFVYHRIARGGAGPLDFNRADLPQTAGILTDLSPDLLIVMLDWPREEEKPTFVQDTERLLDFYVQAMPETPVILMSHHPFKEEIHEEAVWLYQIAQERGMGFINLYDAIPGGLAQMQEMGLMLDSVHFTVAGGQWFGNYVYDLLSHDGACLPPTVASQPQDVSVDEGSPAVFSVGSGDADAYQWRKDGADIPGAVLNKLVIVAAVPEDGGSYDCRLSNGCDSTLSDAAVLTVNPAAWWYRDTDGDGFGDDADALFEVEQPEGYVALGGDCDDGDPARYPGAAEVLNGIDDDCDGEVDEGFETWWYRDGDGDGFGDDGDALFGVDQPEGYVAIGGDCDDLDPAVNPAAAEVCDGVDNNCDGQTDEGSGPEITEDPIGGDAVVGATVVLSVGDSGGTEYQWRKDGAEIEGATGAVYQILCARLSDSGTYDVAVSNPCGQAVSAGAVLTVRLPTPPATPGASRGAEAVHPK